MNNKEFLQSLREYDGAYVEDLFCAIDKYLKDHRQNARYVEDVDQEKVKKDIYKLMQDIRLSYYELKKFSIEFFNYNPTEKETESLN